MTRFGVMKHLKILEGAGLITTRKVGRQKRHYLNPVPIRLIHDRWVSKYTAPMAAALVELKTVLEGSSVSGDAVQVYQIVIRATPERIWQSLTDPVFSRRYPFYMAVTSAFGIGDAIVWVDDKTGRTAVGGVILESDAPRRLVHTWVIRYDAAYSDETSRVTWLIEPVAPDLCRLTLTHDVTGAPLTASHVTNGWTLILSGIKTLLETGEPLVFTQ